MRADSLVTTERILGTAARLFAQHGYDGVSLRKIAESAGTQIGLIHYHFGKKENLFRAVWTWRYTLPAKERNARIDAIDFDRDAAAVLADIVDHWFMPVFSLREGSGRDFLIILGRELCDPKEHERGCLRDFIDPHAQPVLDAVKRALPELTATALAWGYQAMTGAALLHVMDADRTTRLSNGLAVSGDIDAAYPNLRDFIVGGWLRLADKPRSSLQAR